MRTKSIAHLLALALVLLPTVITIETAQGTTIALDRGPGGLRARRTTKKGREIEWTVMGASRGEAGILGEGVRQALLRDPTYGPALAAARRLAK